MNIKNYLIPTKQNGYKPYLLRKIAVVAYCFVLVFVNTLGGIIEAKEVEASDITPEKLIELTNKERRMYGLNELTYSAELSSAALAKANNMLSLQYWDHYGPNGETPWQFIRGAGYDYIYAGENLAKGFSTSEGVVEAWMASPSHKANIVSANYKEIGITAVRGELLGRQTILVVQMFGNRAVNVQGAEENNNNNNSTPVVVEPNNTPEPSQNPAPTTTTPVQAPTQTPVQTPVQTPTQPQTSTQTPTQTPVQTPEQTPVVKEKGEIKSIMITNPVPKTVVTSPSQSIEGKIESTLDENSYIVDVYEGANAIGSVSSDSLEWEFSKNSDWSEGSHNIKVNINGTELSDETTFILDSTAPMVELSTVAVRDLGDKLKLSFSVTEEPEKAILIAGSNTYNLDIDDLDLSIELVKENVANKSVKVELVDAYGNSSQTDISEYFLLGEEEAPAFSIASLGVAKTISIVIVLSIAILLCIEIVYLIKYGMFKRAVQDILTVGVLWIILAIAIFTGYSGSII